MTLFYLLAKVVAVLICLAYAAVACLLYINQDRFIFPGAFRPLPAGTEALGRDLGLRATTIPVTDGESLFALTRAPDAGKPVIIVFHGNGSYPESYGFLHAGWIAAGYGIVTPAARGYPRSQGRPGGPAMLADALRVFDWARTNFGGGPVIVLGHSLGTSLAVHVAAQRDVAGVVLVSPFLSMLELVRARVPYLPVWLLLASPFRSDLDIGKVTKPILVFQGDRDEVVPLQSAQALASLATSPVEFHVIAGAGHGAGMFSTDMISRIDAFIGRFSR
jgi:alpha-beta hydrolase superfamily lysophospholipase